MSSMSTTSPHAADTSVYVVHVDDLNNVQAMIQTLNVQVYQGLSIACPQSSHLPVISITTDPWGWRFCREVEQLLLLCNDPNKMSIVNINVTLNLVNGWGMLKIAWSKRQDGRTVLDGIDWHWFKFFICKGHCPWVSPVPWNVAVLVAAVLVFCIVDGTKVQIVVAAGLFAFLNVWNIIPIYLWAMAIWRIAHPFLVCPV